ncbi:glycosyltransferase family 9 protein [Mariniflexile sp. AS56]|uniref:glycosyltransferase family 9 protein n=1 Tax=Mariniflexile sp. AS56 TaxID=3063957 RepID=UPI0026EF9B90|nr:glycosyltransferase family 9 protein [Mariniflexile sp. AS56]MDO7172171.1 glycosyltransferase family 9 protein [Mariniflexile sp. AS56]
MANLPKHILVIRLSAMGDVAMSVPVLRAFTEQHPSVKVTVLTRGFFAPFFRDLDNVSVYAANLKAEHKGVLGLYKLSKELRRLGIDAVADLHNVLRSSILKVFFFGIKTVQIDKGRTEKKALVSGENFQQLKTTHQRYIDVFETFGFKIDVSNPYFPKKSSLNKKTQALLGSDSIKQIGIAPFAAHEGKMYPLDGMEGVIEALSKDYKVVLFGGGQKEIAILNELETSFGNVVSVAGKLSLDEELDLISNLEVMLSMDSGNAHIAAMLGIKVVTVWGVTHPFAGFAPFNQPTDYALLADRNQFPQIPTSVYGNKYPENYKEASRSIPPEAIIEKIKSIV